MAAERRAGFARGTLWELCALLVAAAVVSAGCVTKKKAQAQERRAFIAGQQQALARIQQAQNEGQGPCVMINGEVRNRVVPWTEGLTLAKALVAADYYGSAEPGQIIIVHLGMATRVDPKQLLNGTDIPLQPGDVVQITPPAPAPKP